jgi:hypothetical protein
VPDLSHLVGNLRAIPGYLYGLLVRFLKQLLLAVALFAVTTWLLPADWGPFLSVTLPFALAFAPFVFVAIRWYRQLQRDEARSELDREEREHRQLLALAAQRGIPPEVFAPLEDTRPSGAGEGSGDGSSG